LYDSKQLIQDLEVKKNAWKRSEGIEFEVQDTIEKIGIGEVLVGNTRKVLVFSKCHSETY
jgi:hypothetical protein